MPVHEWSRVDANLFHHFHQCWTIAICDALNAGGLPNGYSAMVEQNAAKLLPDHLHLRANRIAIRHRLRKVVCIFEAVSPGNKASHAALRAFVDKTREFLEAGVNILVVDLFPPSSRDPGGIHEAIWDVPEAEEPFELPPDQPLTLAAYVAGDIRVGRSIQAFVESVGVGQELADMPAFLDADHYAPVPLERTYQVAWSNCPADMRYLVEHWKLPDE